jgi:hypothetical protein
MRVFDRRDRDGFTWEDLHGVTAEELYSGDVPDQTPARPAFHSVPVATKHGDMSEEMRAFVTAQNQRRAQAEAERVAEVDSYWRDNKAYVIRLMETEPHKHS